MSKKRAFVRYSKQGKIVPGSLILTNGSHPNGPSTWREVPADLCCDSSNPCPELPPCFTWNLAITSQDLINSTGNSGEIVNVLGYDFIAINNTSYDLSILCGSCCPFAGSSGGPIDITFCGSLALGFYFKDNVPVFISGTPTGRCN